MTMPRADLYPSYFITGASSGIGRDLALDLARRARAANVPVALAITARREVALRDLREELLGVHPRCMVVVKPLDVKSGIDAIRSVINECHDALGPLHCFVANAGIIKPKREIGADENYEADEAVIQTDLLSAMATIDAAVHYIKRHQINKIGPGAHIAGVSSLAGTLVVPYHSSYAVAKTGMITYLRILALETRGTGIAVSIIKPGLIHTDLTKHLGHWPFAITSEQCAAQIADQIVPPRGWRALLGGANEVYVPWFPWAIAAAAANLVPGWLYERISAVALNSAGPGGLAYTPTTEARVPGPAAGSREGEARAREVMTKGELKMQ
ncbi:hypothetical protein AMAG_03154 [Allomyces macrogynus ATCC 38327]|uniref:NAD(P)-binding protein n=1 Tax=Allomyces macrogynus (strain ATCC 38327) TaxID=578462 RepID=A0A0L0S4T5_ALLM3|nr:hypothetical protein AMAG_03154 [Allomyces macrogynus ATCC 38327]|eukprot:KNE57441.1 hypothetical protein AMAG_03154 [Allomyces macrogynus ATCC 38327]